MPTTNTIYPVGKSERGEQNSVPIAANLKMSGEAAREMGRGNEKSTNGFSWDFFLNANRRLLHIRRMKFALTKGLRDFKQFTTTKKTFIGKFSTIKTSILILFGPPNDKTGGHIYSSILSNL